MRCVPLFAVLALLSAAPALAQTNVVNPAFLSFTPSPDHAMTAGGVPIVGKYVLDVVLQTNLGAISLSKDLGKPDPDATNTITVPVGPEMATLPNGSYIAFVSAVGPEGSARSDPSSPFARVGVPQRPGQPVLKK